jgi:hypothetical protein
VTESPTSTSRPARGKPAAEAPKPAAEAAAKPAPKPAKAKSAPKPASAVKAAPKPAKPASAARPAKPRFLAARSKAPIVIASRHPNLGLAPIDLTAGHPDAAEKIRSNAPRLSAGALESALIAEPTIRARNDEAGLRRLLRDAELMVDRLAYCLASADDRWLVEYAEWIVPIYRRRGVPLADLSAVCAGLRETVGPQLKPDELAVATRSLDAAIAVFTRDGRLAGDAHKRNALWKWLYRGV